MYAVTDVEKRPPPSKEEDTVLPQKKPPLRRRATIQSSSAVTRDCHENSALVVVVVVVSPLLTPGCTKVAEKSYECEREEEGIEWQRRGRGRYMANQTTVKSGACSSKTRD